jgi:DNA-binding CsgD family transcriptional regulator
MGATRELTFSAMAAADEDQDFSSLDRFARIAEAGSLQELASEVRKVAAHLGFSHYLYGARVRLPNGDTLQYIFSGYPDAWMRKYQAMNYIEIDPIVEHCFLRNSNIPLLWSEKVFDSPIRRDFWDDASGHGVASGISVPVRGAQGEIALFSGANPDFNKSGLQHQSHVAGIMYVLGSYVHEAVRRLVFEPEKQRANHPELTPREAECLKWWIAGKSAWDISQLQSISERGVRFHLDNAKRKLGARSKTEAIARAVRLKLHL